MCIVELPQKTSHLRQLYADLRVVPWNLTQKVEDGGGYDGVDTDEEVDAHIDDESHLSILEDTWQEIHPGEGGKPEELTMTEYFI